MTQVTNLLASLIEELCGERTGTNTGAVSLHNAEYLANLVRTDTQTGASTCTDSIWRCHERIATKVYIKHSTLCTFAQHTLARAQYLVNLMLRIDDRELAQVLDTLQPLLLDLSNVVIEVERFQNSLVASLMGSILFFEVLKDIAYTQTITWHFVGICWTNALTCCTYLVLTFLSLIGSIEYAMG